MVLSRQSEKFLIGQSRKFLLTAVRLKDGTNRDEPTGTGLVGLAETSQGRKHQPTGGRPEDWSERPMGKEAAQADDQARRRGGRAWAARAALQSQAAGRDSTTSCEAFEATGLARFRPDIRQPTAGQTAWDRSQRRVRAEVDDRGRHVAEQVATAGRGACLAASSKRLWRTGAVGYLGARLAGRKRAGALPGAHDRRRYQLELGPLRRARCDTAQHGCAVGVPGEEWPDGGRLHGPRFDVHRAAARGRKQRRAARSRPADAARASLTRTGNRVHPGLLSPSERAH